MKSKLKYLLLFILLFSCNIVKATPANDNFNDDNLYKCIIDAHNLNKEEKVEYSYVITQDELNQIKILDCSKYKGTIEDITGLKKLNGLTSINLSGNTFLGGSLTLTKEPLTLKSNISLPNGLSITNKTYKIDNSKIVKIENDKVYPLTSGSTYVTMTGKVSGNDITEKYLVSVSGTIVKKSSNTKLASLYLSKGEFKFDSDVRKYSTIVDNSVNNVTITATLLDKKSKFVSGYGPRTIELKSGTNYAEIKVEAEDGTVGTYIISIIRSDGNDKNNRLINIELSVGKINFDPDVYTYNFSVASNVEEIDVKGVSESPLANVKVTDIDGNTKSDKISSKLKVGTNKIAIVVTAESGLPGTYQLIINREGFESVDNYLSNIVIKNYDIKFSKEKYTYDLHIGNESSLDISATTEKSTSTYNISGNSNLENGSKILINASDKDGNTRTYTINIHKKSTSSGISFMTDLPIKWIVLGIEFIIIIILLIILIVKASRKPKKVKKRSVKTYTHTLGNSNSIVCKNCNTVNDIKSKTCYVCGNELK